MMNSPALRYVLIGSLASTFALLVAAQQQNFDNVEITVHRVAGNVYYLEGQGGNIGLSVGPDGVVMVDDQFAPLTDRIVAAIRTLSAGEIRYVINTHVHPDHTGGNENLGSMGIDILAHERVRERLAEGIRGGPPAPAAALPVLTYADYVTLHLNGEDVRVFAVPPAHTDGDSFIYFTQSDVLHMGDVFRTTAYPVIDTTNGGTLQGTLDALGIAIGLAGPDTRILPGHGVLSTRADVLEFRDMILAVRNRVAPLVETGATYEEVVAANPTADFDARWGSPNRFLPALYEQLGGLPAQP